MSPVTGLCMAPMPLCVCMCVCVCMYTKSLQSLSTLQSHTLQVPLSMVFQARILEWVAMPSSRDLPNPGSKPMSPTLQVDFLPSEPPGKPHPSLCYLLIICPQPLYCLSIHHVSAYLYIACLPIRPSITDPPVISLSIFSRPHFPIHKWS